MQRERRFPTDKEVQTFIQERFCAPEDMPRLAGTSYADQMQAASSESSRSMSAAGQYGTASGDLRYFVRGGDEKGDRLGDHIQRSAVRAYLAAASVGIEPLCPHTFQVRPLMLMCDPPVVFCTNCLQDPSARIKERAAEIGFFFEEACDICGAHSEMMTPTTMGMSNLQITAHACRQCARESEDVTLQEVETIVPVGRNMPCPCGSGRKFKHCCLR